MPDRIIAAGPRIVQRRLVGSEVHVNAFVSKSFPEIHHVAYIRKRYYFLVSHGFTYALHEFVQVFVQFIHPALLMTFAGRERIDFRCDAYDAGDISCLRLRSRHAAKSGGDEKHALHVFLCSFNASVPQLFTCRVHHRDGGAVDNALRTYIHIGAGCHLTVLRYAHCIEPLPVVLLRVVRNHHSVRDYYTWSVLVAREETHRMS